MTDPRTIRDLRISGIRGFPAGERAIWSRPFDLDASRASSLRLPLIETGLWSHPLDMDADVVIVTGPNGSGKTSLLDALNLVLNGEDTRRLHIPWRHLGADEQDAWVEANGGDSSVRISEGKGGRDGERVFDPPRAQEEQRARAQLAAFYQDHPNVDLEAVSWLLARQVTLPERLREAAKNTRERLAEALKRRAPIGVESEESVESALDKAWRAFDAAVDAIHAAGGFSGANFAGLKQRNRPNNWKDRLKSWLKAAAEAVDRDPATLPLATVEERLESWKLLAREGIGPTRALSASEVRERAQRGAAARVGALLEETPRLLRAPGALDDTSADMAVWVPVDDVGERRIGERLSLLRGQMDRLNAQREQAESALTAWAGHDDRPQLKDVIAAVAKDAETWAGASWPSGAPQPPGEVHGAVNDLGAAAAAAAAALEPLKQFHSDFEAWLSDLAKERIRLAELAFEQERWANVRVDISALEAAHGTLLPRDGACVAPKDLLARLPSSAATDVAKERPERQRWDALIKAVESLADAHARSRRREEALGSANAYQAAKAVIETGIRELDALAPPGKSLGGLLDEARFLDPSQIKALGMFVEGMLACFRRVPGWAGTKLVRSDPRNKAPVLDVRPVFNVGGGDEGSAQREAPEGLSALSTGQNSLATIALQLALHLALGADLGLGVLLLDDFVATLDLSELVALARLLRRFAYVGVGRDHRTRQVIITSHHEDLTNRLVDLLMPTGQGQRLLVIVLGEDPKQDPRLFEASGPKGGDDGWKDRMGRVLDEGLADIKRLAGFVPNVRSSPP